MDNSMKQQVFKILHDAKMVSRVKINFDSIIVSSDIFNFTVKVHKTISGVPDDIESKIDTYIEDNVYIYEITTIDKCIKVWVNKKDWMDKRNSGSKCFHGDVNISRVVTKAMMAVWVYSQQKDEVKL